MQNTTIALLISALTVLALWVPAGAFAANNQIQVIFSGAATGNFGAHTGNANFNIWCKLTPGPNANSYGVDCAGSMYFRSLGITREVEETDSGVTENPSTGAFQMHVQSMVDSGHSVNCFLTNVPPVTRGPTNTVNVNCISTPTFGTGSSNTATVIVTGP